MAITGAQIVALAEKYLGAPYVYGGTSPSGWDCSGFVQWVLTDLGVKSVPRTSEEQWAWVDKVSSSQIQPGDLVFAQFPGDNASPGHVGIYVGNNKVLSAEDPAQGTQYDTLTDWGSAIVGYGRVPGSAGGGASGTGGGTNDLSILGQVLELPTQITGFFDDFKTLIDAAMWLTHPGNVARIGAFIVGTGLFIFGVWLLAKSANPELKLPSIPVPVPV